MSYCIYLRKSRKDIDAEAHGEGETLARHENILLSLAKRQNLSIGAIYREIVSGETISSRPVMQQVLKEVESCLWDGVLVMEVERLARGDTIDQGVVQRAFQYSDTLIITPTKTYDPSNEFDQEYFEFGLFMSRREFKTIRRRMRNGVSAAVQEGKYPFNAAPYGWIRVKLEHEKGWTLAFEENEAPIVQLIFKLFTGPERIGVTGIKHYLNNHGIPTRNGGKWTESTLLGILTNITYDQKVGIGKRKHITKIVDGSPTKSRPRSDYDFVSVGRQPRMVPHDVFEEAQTYIGLGTPKTPEAYGVKSPLAGIVVCSECKKRMQRRPATRKSTRNGSKFDVLMCRTEGCPTVGSSLDLVEKELIRHLKEWVDGYHLEDVSPESRTPEKEKLLNLARNEHETLMKQNSRLYDLLEQGVYTTEVFLERSRHLQERIEKSATNIESLEQDLKYEIDREANIKNFIPACHNLLSCYWDLSIEERNKALKILLDSVEYKKTVRNGYGDANKPTFELTIKPRIPKM